jgi:hypothetical protein
VAAATMVWMVYLFTADLSVHLKETFEYPAYDVSCASVSSAFLQTYYSNEAHQDSRLTYSGGPREWLSSDDVDGRLNAICDRQRTAAAGLIGLLAVPAVFLTGLALWNRERRPPSHEAVIRAANAHNAASPAADDPL